jgi:acetamidase/formamidase
MDASIYGRGAGEGFGVHICTGPIAVKGAEPGDVLEVRILDMVPRASRNPDLRAGFSAAASPPGGDTIMTSFSRSRSRAKR